MHDIQWTHAEKAVARRAYEKARLSELAEVVAGFKAAAAAVDDADQLWLLIERMRHVRQQFEQKYDYRYSVLLSVLARLLGEQRIGAADLAGLDAHKLAQLSAAAEFHRR